MYKDDAKLLLDLLGSFWAVTGDSYGTVGGTLLARWTAHDDTMRRATDLFAAMSRFSLPLFARRNWIFHVIRRSARVAVPAGRYGGGRVYGDGLLFTGQDANFHAYASPPDLSSAGLLLNSAIGPSFAAQPRTDFEIRDGLIVFTSDPFAMPFRQQPILVDGAVADVEAGFWIYRGEYDFEDLYKQYGYVLGSRLRSTEQARDFLNAAWDAIVQGGTASSTERLLAAATGTPIAVNDETVLDVWDDGQRAWVTTDARMYRVKPGGATVRKGDAIAAGTPLTGGFTVAPLNSGLVPSGLTGLCLVPEKLGTAYKAGILFRNAAVAVTATPDAAIADLVHIRFPLGGEASEVERFWDGVEAAEKLDPASALAPLLDTRPEADRATPVAAGNVAATVNPLEFLVGKVNRNNAAVIRLRPDLFGEGDTTLDGLSYGLKLGTDPQAVHFVSIELAVSTELADFGFSDSAAFSDVVVGQDGAEEPQTSAAYGADLPCVGV